GLDPAGIREMRDLLRNLVAGGMTVVLSSHILAEVQQICDAVTIIAQGRRVAAGAVTEVLAAHTRKEVRVRLEAVEDQPTAAQLLTNAGATVTVESDHMVVHGIDQPAQITRTLAAHDLYVAELTPVSVDLESVFLELTGTVPVPGQPLQVGVAQPVTAGASGEGAAA